MIVVELTAAKDAAGTTQTFYLADDRFVTKSADTPASTAFEPYLLDPGSIGLHAYSDGRTGGATRLESGEIVIDNTGGRFDAWINYSFDGRPVTIRSGSAGAAYPSAFTTLFVGTVESLDASWDKITVSLRDKQYLLRQPVLTTRYAGTNSLPAGQEGTASDIKGRVKPKAYGKVFNVSPPCVNTSRLEYEVGVCNSVDAVNDRGGALTAGAAYTSLSDMDTTAPSAGGVRAWAAGGYFRLGSTPSGQVTADVTQGASAGVRTAAQILKQLALAAGLSSGEISAADVTALDALNSAVVGIWIDDEATTFQAAMDAVAASVGAWYGFDGTGVLRMGRLTAPSGTPVVTLNDYQVGDNIERRPPRDANIPVYRVTVNHSRIWTVQASDVVGSATAATRAYLAQEYRREVAEDTSVKTQWKLAGEMEVSGLLTSSTDAATEAARLLALHKVRRDVYDVEVDISVVSQYGLKLMDLVALKLPRFGMSAGKSFRLIGLRLELARNRAVLSLWG